MSQSANVESIQVLRDFRLALLKFVEAARASLNEADADLRRHGHWLSEDRRQHGASEQQRRHEKFQRAKLALLEKRLQKTSTGGQPSIVDEEKAVKAAQRALEEALQKTEHTKRWTRRLEEQVLQHKGALQGLHLALDNEAVTAIALLERMIEALERYLATAPPPSLGDLPTAESSGPMSTAPEPNQPTSSTPTSADSAPADPESDEPQPEDLS
ncbi:MAG: hypothetical protein FWC56_03380 [Phycisphaerae bacterium]|nr:hypothetical protein [Phycisphaerae bacterium]